jgi:hypothetical protein
MEKINDILGKLHDQMSTEEIMAISKELSNCFAITNSNIFKHLNTVNDKAKQLIRARDDFSNSIGNINMDRDTSIEELHYSVAHAKSHYLHEKITEFYNHEIQESFYSFGPGVQKIFLETSIDIKKFKDYLQDVIFKAFVDILTDTEKLKVYCFLFRFKESKVITEPIDIQFIIKYLKNKYSKKDYPKKFNKIKVEHFENPFDLDMICLDFYLDNKYLGDLYIFKHFKSTMNIDETNSEKMQKHLTENYEKQLDMLMIN